MNCISPSWFEEDEIRQVTTQMSQTLTLHPTITYLILKGML